MITLRIDVDYAYSNRFKSFLSTFLKAKLGNGYLENSKTIAKMANESKKEVKCYWFFTSTSLPDREMLMLLNNEKHEVCLHAVENVYSEWIILVRHLAKYHYPKINFFFNQHGIKRFPMKIVWHKARRGVTNPYPLKYFGNGNTVGLDSLCYEVGQKEAYRCVGNKIIYVHPDWLFQSSRFSQRGRYFEVLKSMVDGVQKESIGGK